MFVPRVHENGRACCSNPKHLCPKCTTYFATLSDSDPYAKPLAALRAAAGHHDDDDAAALEQMSNFRSQVFIMATTSLRAAASPALRDCDANPPSPYGEANLERFRKENYR